MTYDNKTAVIGMGNLLLTDEGVGVHAIRALRRVSLPPEVEVIEGGTSPDVMTYIETADRLIIIDAMETGDEPGAIYRLPIDDLTTANEGLASVHEINLVAMLKTLRLLGGGPREVVIIGVQPGDMDWGLELSPPLQRRLPQIIGVVTQEIYRQTAAGGVA